MAEQNQNTLPAGLVYKLDAAERAIKKGNFLYVRSDPSMKTTGTRSGSGMIKNFEDELKKGTPADKRLHYVVGRLVSTNSVPAKDVLGGINAVGTLNDLRIALTPHIKASPSFPQGNPNGYWSFEDMNRFFSEWTFSLENAEQRHADILNVQNMYKALSDNAEKKKAAPPGYTLEDLVVVHSVLSKIDPSGGEAKDTSPGKKGKSKSKTQKMTTKVQNVLTKKNKLLKIYDFAKTRKATMGDWPKDPTNVNYALLTINGHPNKIRVEKRTDLEAFVGQLKADAEGTTDSAAVNLIADDLLRQFDSRRGNVAVPPAAFSQPFQQQGATSPFPQQPAQGQGLFQQQQPAQGIFQPAQFQQQGATSPFQQQPAQGQGLFQQQPAQGQGLFQQQPAQGQGLFQQQQPAQGQGLFQQQQFPQQAAQGPAVMSDLTSPGQASQVIGGPLTPRSMAAFQAQQASAGGPGPVSSGSSQKPAATQGQPGSPFGQTQQPLNFGQQQPQASPFGQAQQAQQGGFGGINMGSGTQPSPFGQAQQSLNFGQAQQGQSNGQASPFGQAQQPLNFGQAQQAPQVQQGGFGGINMGSGTQPSPFGQAQQAQQEVLTPRRLAALQAQQQGQVLPGGAGSVNMGSSQKPEAIQAPLGQQGQANGQTSPFGQQGQDITF